MGKNNGKRRFSAWGKVCACFLCASMAVVLAGDVNSSLKAQGSSVGSLQQQLKDLQQANAQRDAKIKELGGDINDNEAAMDLVSEQIDGINSELDKYSQLVAAKQQSINEKNEKIELVEGEISDKEDAIKDKQLEIAELERQNKENLAKFAKLARAMYMNDTSTKIPVLNGSDDWYDYFVYSDVVRNISGQNAKFMQDLLDSMKNQERLIEDLKEDIETLEGEKARLGEEKAAVEADMAQLKSEQAEYESYLAEKKNYLYGLSADNEYLKSKVNGLQYEKQLALDKMEELNSQIEQLIREANSEGTGSWSGTSSENFIWPLNTNFQYITTYFGYSEYHGHVHRGIDVGNAGIANANIYAAQEGTVITAFNGCSHNYGKGYTCCSSYGNYVIIKHPNGYSTLYAHMSSMNVYVGQYVSQGQVIGHVGTTGWSTGYHLHFEIRDSSGTATNPFNYTYANL